MGGRIVGYGLDVSNVPEQRPDPRRDLRVSHDDRDRVAEMLRDATADGRLDVDELEHRLEQAFAARTYGELEPLVADLPSTRSAQPAGSGAGTAPTATRSQAILSEQKRNGVWVVPETYTATAVLGSVELDLREAAFAGPEASISCVALMGEIKIPRRRRCRGRRGRQLRPRRELDQVQQGSPADATARPGAGGSGVRRSWARSVIERLAPGDRRLRRFRG